MGNAGDPPPPIHTAWLESDLVDISDYTMLDLLMSNDPEITGAMRRLLAQRRHRRDVLLGWNSAYVATPLPGEH